LAVIALWLGHDSTQTTQVYLHLSLKGRRWRRQKPFNRQKIGRYKPGDRVLAFLDAL